MNVKVITTALNCLIGSVALTFVNDNQSFELATKAAVSRHGREAIVMYQWYSACVQEPSLDDFEVWLARQVEKHPNFKKKSNPGASIFSVTLKSRRRHERSHSPSPARITKK